MSSEDKHFDGNEPFMIGNELVYHANPLINNVIIQIVHVAYPPCPYDDDIAMEY